MGIVSGARKELTERVIPLLSGLRDDGNGGFRGIESHDPVASYGVGKDMLRQSQMLWFFSECYLVLGDPCCLDNASHCYRFLKEHGTDPVNGGIRRLVKEDGAPAVKLKDTACQASCIYALSAFFKASGDDQALKLALGLFEVTEKNLADPISYAETLTEDWKPVSDNSRAGNETAPRKAAETYLRLLEAYTGLYRVSFDERVLNRLIYIIRLFSGRIYDPVRHGIILLLGDDMEPLTDRRSPALDAEAARLVYRACEAAEKDELKTTASEMYTAILNELMRRAYEGGINDRAEITRFRTESIPVLLKGHELTGNRKYLDTALDMWSGIKAQASGLCAGSTRCARSTENRFAGTPEWAYCYGRLCLEIMEAG